MDKQLREILIKKLKNNGVNIPVGSIKKYKHQGWMSSVFTADSNVGPLIIHEVNLVAEHQKNKVWEKFSGLAEVLKRNPQIPTSKIFYSGLINNSFLLVQNFIPGDVCGKRILDKKNFHDEWILDQKFIVPKILSALALLHKIDLKGFGWPVLIDGELRGFYKTWKNFIEARVSEWLEIISKADRWFSPERISNLKSFFKKNIRKIEYDGPAVLVHGDAINPGNILFHNGGIFLLDWEWAIASDPAWEFCDIGWWNEGVRDLADYFYASGMVAIERKNFLERVKLYIPFWLLWSTWHVYDVDKKIYIPLRNLLIKSIN